MEKEYKMTEAARAAAREYNREWRRKHPEKQAEYNRRRWERIAAQLQNENQKPAGDPEPEKKG